jgi:5-carboxymethyl-2-hydroxymuconate isomerase
MPHLVVLYTANLEAATDMAALCRSLADAMLAVRDEQAAQVFPTGGVRVLAYPAAHSAVADGQRDYAFLYLNLRMGGGRSEAVKRRAGETLLAAAKAHLAPLFATRYLGLTLQIDEGQEVFDAKHSTIHPLFR